ncbi:HDOD domain-containing protein [Pseudomonas sp. 5P_3.1_Bac2]|uniref:HDOD domain-containing protein n=1 Tax=Pseudomonas sp. 5P_3.1_Bac2 TaxID=2971617 RepID=UPI0021C81F66|nr:HDOD domain-containing protein [Pseudomonas sp. 5P_3.1_Bac2]MCU1719065.1 HDOD domain-containing protein [Pseudomonas sp. 5P_3.1_Bac2]
MTVTAMAAEILIADADPNTADLLSQLVLEIRPEAQVHRRSDGDSALRLCQQQELTLIIADSDLPGLDGLELLRQLRRLPSTAEQAYVLLSNRLDAASVRAAVALKPSAYLAKPIQNGPLRKRLADILSQAEQTRRQVPASNLRSLDDHLLTARHDGLGAPLLDAVRDAVQQCMHSEKPDLRELAQSYGRDPQITACLIAAANSAAHHQGTPCQTLAQALPRLGHGRALNLVLGLAVQRNTQLSDPRLAELAQHTWQAAQQAAELAHWLGLRLRVDAELCYTAGLLHNIGELALLRSLQSWQDAGGVLNDERLQQHFVQSAASFGSALRIHWRLPLGLREPIAGFYQLGSGVFSREALVLNLTGCVLRLPADKPLRQLQDERCVRLLRLPGNLLEEIPRPARESAAAQ